MKVTTHKAAHRGSEDYGWLKPNYYFSFGSYANRAKVNFGLLRVLNDDFIAGGGAFGKHPHENMEIVTIPLPAHYNITTAQEAQVLSKLVMCKL